MAGQPVKPAETLAERFWSVAREMEAEHSAADPDPVVVIQHVLKVLDGLEAGQVGRGVTSNTLDFLVMLRQYQLMGDLTYASPEQARGEEMDDRSLVFSVGVLAFEKLTGRHPFGAEAAGRRLARMQKGELGSGVSFFPKLPEKLRQVLMRAMGPFPEDRFESLKELRAALERFVEESRPSRALPGVAGGEAPTRVVAMSTLEQMARLTSNVTDVTDTPSPDIITIPEPDSLRPSRSRYAPIGWIALGAALASLVFILIGERSPTPPAATSTPSSVDPVPVRAPVPTPPPPPVVTPVAATAAAPAASEPPATFDPELGGKRGLDNARACFTPARVSSGVLFGAGLLYGADGVARKVYFGNQERLSPDERRCIVRSLIGVSAGGPAGHNVIVEYTMRYRPTGAAVTIRR